MFLVVVLLLSGAILMVLGAWPVVRLGRGLTERPNRAVATVGAVLALAGLESAAVVWVAASRGRTGLAAAAAFGGALFLVDATFGAGLLVRRRPVQSPGASALIGPSVAVAVTGLFLYDSIIGRLEGAFLVLVFLAYLSWVVLDARGREAPNRALPETAPGPGLPETAPVAPRTSSTAIWPAWWWVGGLVVLAGGAWLAVDGSLRLSTRGSLSEGFVGAALLGALAAAGRVVGRVASVDERSSLGITAAFATFVSLLTFVPGAAALFHPITVDGVGAVAFLGASAAYALVAAWLLWRGTAGRVLGTILVAGYIAWLVYAGSL